MPKTKSSSQSAEVRKAKEDQDKHDDLDKYDIYSLNDEIWKKIQEAERKKDFHPIDDIKAFLDRYR